MSIVIQRVLVGWSFVLLGAAPGLAQSAPTNFQATVKGPTEVYLSWNAVAGTTGYHVFRAEGAATAIRLTTAKIAATNYTDATATPSTTYRYKAVAVDAAGLTYSSVTQTVTTPAATAPVATIARLRAIGAVASAVPSSPTMSPSLPMGNPAQFSANLQGGQVVLNWSPVAGVSEYLVLGPGMGSTGRLVPGASTSIPLPGAGQHEWTVASLGSDHKVLTNWTSWPKARLTLSAGGHLAGSYRLSIAGFKVNHETYDDPWQWDGKRDEVYVITTVEHFNRATNNRFHLDTVRSKVFGDANGYPDRVPQGRASDVGGLMTGDVVPFGWDERSILPSPAPGWFPLVLWQGSLANEEDALFLQPVIWEWDKGDDETLNGWLYHVDKNPLSSWHSSSVQATVPGTAISAARIGYGLYNYLGWQQGRDRPIGLDDGMWDVMGWMLTREKIENELSRSSATGGVPGLLALRFVDGSNRTSGSLDGDYTVYLRLERLP